MNGRLYLLGESLIYHAVNISLCILSFSLEVGLLDHADSG